MNSTPLEKHLKEQKKKRLAREQLNASLTEASGVTTLPGEVIERLSVAYKDCQTSLNNLDAAMRIVKESLSTGQNSSQISPHHPVETQASQPSHPDSTGQNQQISQQTNLSQLPSLNRLQRNLRGLEIRQIQTVRSFRKLFRLLGFRQSFVDGLEGIVSVYSDDSEPEINIEKNIGLMENAATE